MAKTKSGITVERNSLGDFICPICKAIHLTLTRAEDCINSHKQSSEDLKSSVVIKDVSGAISQTHNALKANDPMAASFDLVEHMITDYHYSRQNDIADRGKPGPLTLQFAKNAAEALNNLNKLVYGEKSSRVNVNVKGEQVDDLTALKDLLTDNSKSKSRMIEGKSDSNK